MKRMYKLAVAASAMAVLLAGCGGNTTPSSSAASAGSSGASKGSVAMVVNGPLGDNGFFDDAERGIQQLKSQGYTTQTIQSDANNPAQWSSNLQSVSGNKWDIVVVGTTQMKEPLQTAAKKFPNQKYIIFDDSVALPNVASIMYKQNEGSYLAGVLAGLVVDNKDKFPLDTGNKTVGLVGGMDIPVINDFVVGFKKGVATVDPAIQVKVSYVGSFTDSNKGYDQAKLMYSQGADVVFQVAGGAGIGVLKAAKDANRYAIGVDSNQNALQPGHVLASMEKKIGDSLVLAVTDAMAGKLKYGSTTSYGLANKGVGLDFANNSNLVPADIQKQVDDYAAKVVSGEITVPTTLG